MMDYYLRRVDSLPDPRENSAVLQGIPDWRVEYILRYLHACDRKLSLGAWRLMEEILKRHGFSAENVTLGLNGKPECKGVYFNLSHSGDMVLCVIGDVPVGCDIEKVTDAPLEVADRYFGEEEQRYIDEVQNDPEVNRRFFRLWTMKESYLKMTGEGMGLSPERIEIDLDTLAVLRDSVRQPCTLTNITHGDYEITICTGSAKTNL